MANLILFNLETLVEQPQRWDGDRLGEIQDKLLTRPDNLSQYERALLKAFEHYNLSTVNVLPEKRKMPYLVTKEAIKYLVQLQSQGVVIGVYLPKREVTVDQLVKASGLSGFVPPDNIYSVPVLNGVNDIPNQVAYKNAFEDLMKKVEGQGHNIRAIVDINLKYIHVTKQAILGSVAGKNRLPLLFHLNPEYGGIPSHISKHIIGIGSLSQITGYVGQMVK